MNNQLEDKLFDILKSINDSIKESSSQKNTPKQTLTIEECVELTGIGKNTIIELINKPNTDFPYFKVKSKNLINRTLLLDWLTKVTEEHRTI